MRQGVKFAAATGVCAALMAGGAEASTTVLGGGFAEICSRAALASAEITRLEGRRRTAVPPAQGLEACNTAIAQESLSRRDLAATRVNRGILRMGLRDYPLAQSDFAAAVKMMPELAEAHVNLGGSLVAQRLYEEGVAEIDRGLALNPDQPEKAYFNRAIAHEALGNATQAYRDFTRASQLDPDWQAPQVELTRFTVTRR